MKRTILGFWFCVLLTIVSCRSATTSIQEIDTVPTPMVILDDEFYTTLTSGLSIDVYELDDQPSTEPLTFDPVSNNSQEEILAIHQDERKDWFPDRSFFNEMIPCIKAYMDHSDLIACATHKTYLVSKPGSLGSVEVEVILDDKVIYSAEAGEGSPINNLRTLWSYADHWALEYAHVTIEVKEENMNYSYPIGHIVIDGVDINEQYGFDETFGYQLLGDKPFYFYEKDGQIGISFDDEMHMLGFEEILHYGCCSAGMLNPIQAQNMVALFAQRDGTWYYVEIGMFE